MQNARAHISARKRRSRSLALTSQFESGAPARIRKPARQCSALLTVPPTKQMIYSALKSLPVLFDTPKKQFH